MMKPFTKVAAAFFGLVTLAHAIRLFYPFRIMIAGEYVPRFASGVVVLVAGFICYGLWKESKRA